MILTVAGWCWKSPPADLTRSAGKAVAELQLPGEGVVMRRRGEVSAPAMFRWQVAGPARLVCAGGWGAEEGTNMADWLNRQTWVGSGGISYPP